MSRASINKTTQEWNTINWAKVQRKVFKLQKSISRTGKANWNKLSNYFSHGNHGIWTFRTKEMQLYYHAETEIKRHQLVRPEASPYDGNWTYWSKRRGEYPETPTRVAKLIKKQKGKCTLCGQHFTPDDLIEIDHIIPKSQGGEDNYKNYQALHRHCHDVKSKNDGSYDWSDNGYEWKDDVLTVPMTKD